MNDKRGLSNDFGFLYYVTKITFTGRKISFCSTNYTLYKVDFDNYRPIHCNEVYKLVSLQSINSPNVDGH